MLHRKHHIYISIGISAIKRTPASIHIHHCGLNMIDVVFVSSNEMIHPSMPPQKEQTDPNNTRPYSDNIKIINIMTALISASHLLDSYRDNNSTKLTVLSVIVEEVALDICQWVRNVSIFATNTEFRITGTLVFKIPGMGGGFCMCKCLVKPAVLVNLFVAYNV